MSQKIKTSVEIDGSLTASQIANATTDTDKFLVSDGGTVKYRTGAELASDLGIASGSTSKVQHQVKAGVAINKGQAVYVTSADGTNMIVGLASNASEATSSKTMGLLNATVAVNDFADVITEGLLDGLNTSAATVGDPVWLGTGGNLIYGLANKPYAPNHLVFIGIVTRVNANNGEIFVKVQNGFELNEIHDVDLKSTTPSGNDILAYEGAPVNLWKNKSIAAVLGYTPYNASNPAGYTTNAGTVTSVSGSGGYGGLTLSGSVTTSGSLTLGGTPSGVWPISITGNADTVDNYHASSFAKQAYVNVGYDFNTLSAENSDSAIAYRLESSVANPPNGSIYNWSLWQQGNSTRGSQIAVGAYGGNEIYFRGANNDSGSYRGWQRVLHDGNYSSYAVPTSRTITINGTSYDLSANRSWTVTASETDTLQTVTSRGNTTTTSITANSIIIPSFETATNVLSFRSGIPDGTNVGIRAKATVTANRDGLELLGYNGIDFSINNGNTVAGKFNNYGQFLVNAASSGYGANLYGYNLGMRGNTSQAYMSIALSNQTLDTQGLIVGIDTGYARFHVRDSKPISFANGDVERMTLDTSANLIANGSVRAPIFYDSNDTTYYGDFASTSNFRNLLLNNQTTINTTTPGLTSYGLTFMGGNSDQANGMTWTWGNTNAQAGIYVQSSGAYGTKMYFATTDSFATGAKTAMAIDHYGNVSLNRGTFSNGSVWINNGVNYNSYNENIRLFNANNGVSVIAFGASGTSGTPQSSILGFSDRLEIRVGANGTAVQRNYDNYVEAMGSSRAPIFYDSNNTAYYVDPASSSSLKGLTVVDTIYGDITGTAGSLAGRAADRYIWGDGANGRSKGMGGGNANTSDQSNSSGFYFGSSVTGMPSSDWWNWLTVAGDSWSGSDGYRWQMAGSFWGDDWRLRRQTSGGWNSWHTILHSGNYSSFCWALEGSWKPASLASSTRLRGATSPDGGEFGLAYSNGQIHPYTDGFFYQNEGQYRVIDSNSISSQSVSYATNSANADNAGHLRTAYVGGQQLNPQVYFNDGIGLKVAMTAKVGYWSDTVWINGYAGGDVPWMCALHTQRNSSPRMYISSQQHISSSYGTAYEFITDYNKGEYVLTLSTDQDVTGIKYFLTNNGGYVGSLSSAKLQAYSTGNNSAYMSFHKSGHYAVNMGLDADNVMRIGGWSAASNRWQLDMSGNMTVAGDVTAYSDARVKENIETISKALDKVLSLRGVTYNRIDSEDKSQKIGVIAQEVQNVIPQVVHEQADGMLGVSYGNITALLIEAIKEQQTQIEELKQLVNKLINK